MSRAVKAVVVTIVNERMFFAFHLFAKHAMLCYVCNADKRGNLELGMLTFRTSRVFLNIMSLDMRLRSDVKVFIVRRVACGSMLLSICSLSIKSALLVQNWILRVKSNDCIVAEADPARDAPHCFLLLACCCFFDTAALINLL